MAYATWCVVAYVAYASYLCGSWRHIAQVDKSCLGPKFPTHLPWSKVQTDAEGSITELLWPPLAIALLFFHPSNFEGMHKRAAEVWTEDEEGGEAVREYGHPFSCDMAVRAQRVVDGKPPVEGVTDVLVGARLGKDKTEVERAKSLDATHLELLNTALEQWFKRHSKVLLVLSPPYHKDADQSAQENARAKQRQYQKSMVLVLILLEACARMGILCHHRSPPPPPARRRVMVAACSIFTGICHHREHGWFRLWPLLWMWATDRDEGKDLGGVNRAWQGMYVPTPIPFTVCACVWDGGGDASMWHVSIQSICWSIVTNFARGWPLCRRICLQCVELTGEFNVFKPTAHYNRLRRHLDHMLCLPLPQRQSYSFLSQSADLHHGPLAIACVDPDVVRLDFNCIPPDRWHGVVNMIEDLTSVVRQQLVEAKLSEVAPQMYHMP